MLHLASRSPRRSELLARLGFAFGVLELDVPEHRQPGEPPEDYVRRVAREKAGAGLLQVVANPHAIVLGADTEVIPATKSSASRAMPPMPPRCSAAWPAARTR